MPATEPTPLAIVLDTVSRLESKLDTGFATVATKLDTKADKTDIIRLDTRLGEHEKRIERAEVALRDRKTEEATRDHEESQRRMRRQNRWTVLIGAISAAALVVSVLIGVIH